MIDLFPFIVALSCNVIYTHYLISWDKHVVPHLPTSASSVGLQINWRNVSNSNASGPAGTVTIENNLYGAA